jgi:hypothetical protein
MFSFKNIVKKHIETFYDYRTSRRKSVLPRYLILVILSLAITSVFNELVADFYANIITVQSILVGFTFNVMFFLTSNNRTTIKSNQKAIEVQQKIDKLNLLSEEIFYNVCYFNLVAIISIIIAIILAGIPTYSPTLFVFLDKSIGVEFLERLPHGQYSTLAIKGLMGFLYFCVIESFITFLSTARRVTYLFHSQRQLTDSCPEN